jgi:hypothetical protein
MRTTVRLDDALLADAKAAAARSGRTLTQVIEDALREALARRESTGASGAPVALPTFAGKGLQPGVDLDSTASLLELMDERAAR